MDIHALTCYGFSIQGQRGQREVRDMFDTQRLFRRKTTGILKFSSRVLKSNMFSLSDNTGTHVGGRIPNS